MADRLLLVDIVDRSTLGAEYLEGDTVRIGRAIVTMNARAGWRNERYGLVKIVETPPTPGWVRRGTGMFTYGDLNEAITELLLDLGPPVKAVTKTFEERDPTVLPGGSPLPGPPGGSPGRP